MILVLAVTAWIVIVSLATGLCAAARAGDLAQPPAAPAGRGHREPTAWEPSEHVEISAHANVRPAHSAESGASLHHGDGIAA
jgi:hypothetical protein